MYVVVQSTTNPTFRSKFSDFMVFSVINFQFNTNLLNFYTGGKSKYSVFRDQNDIIQFLSSAIKCINYLNLLQKCYQEKYWFSKNTAENGI